MLMPTLPALSDRGTSIASRARCSARMSVPVIEVVVRALYRRLGFVGISPCDDVHLPGTRFYMLAPTARRIDRADAPGRR